MARRLSFVLLFSKAAGFFVRFKWKDDLQQQDQQALSLSSSTPTCLSPEDGYQLATDFQALIRNYSAAAADRLLAPEVPLGAPTYRDRDELKAALERQSGRPTPVTLRTVDVVTCNTIVLKWTAAFGEARLPVRGIQILTVEKAGPIRGWAIKTIDTEFNSLAYLVNLGGTYKMPEGGSDFQF
uniref:NTF2-like domain-containing protein n=1 Tax=Colletotrichum fructicola (strain Nara gc5) TaxID=1213859 RepID=L2FHM4_COLFN